MEGHHQQSDAKTEKREIEKNRRNYMKTLYSILFSHLPHHASKERLAVMELIDETIKYIISLKAELEKSQDIKNRLIIKKRPHTCMTTETNSTSKSPEIQVHQMGPRQDFILINGLNNHLKFYNILRVIHEEGGEVLHANFSASGYSIFQLGFENIGGSPQNLKATKLFKRVEELINGSTSCSEVESQLPLWDFEIEPDFSELLNAEFIL